jgi:Common central domain of tyrosinase
MAHRYHLKELTNQERGRLHSLITQYITEDIVNIHTRWHFQLRTPTGQEFLDFHRSFIGDLENFIANQNLSSTERQKFLPLPVWDPADAIPRDFPYNAPEPRLARRNQIRRIPLPTYYTLQGGNTPDPDYGHLSLKEFRSIEELGWSLSGGQGSTYHNSVHGEVGGAMGLTDNSPRDPIFWPWHSWLDDIYSNYQATLVTVPNVVGMHTSSAFAPAGGGRFPNTAQSVLTAAGFKVGIISRAVQMVPIWLPFPFAVEGNVNINDASIAMPIPNFVNAVVAAQDPIGGAMAPMGAKVDLIEVVYVYVPRRGIRPPGNIEIG